MPRAHLIKKEPSLQQHSKLAKLHLKNKTVLYLPEDSLITVTENLEVHKVLVSHYHVCTMHMRPGHVIVARQYKSGK
jgi:hypothetical protein